VLISTGTILDIVFEGTAKPIPEKLPESESTPAVFIPITSSPILRRGPPELPGLINASV
jgi:hypothetical protein